MSKGTPLSSQIVWMEQRIAELERENRDLRMAYRTVRGTLANIGQSMYECTGSARRTLNAFPVDPTIPEETEESE